MNTYKTHFFALLAIAILFLVGIGTFNFVMDPYQIYRKASLYSPLFFANQRYQNAGLINSYLGGEEDYDTVLIGTSRSANTNSGIAQSILKEGKVLKLCIGGGRLSELSLILKSALHTGKVKRVLFETAWPMSIQTEDMWHPSYPFPTYLYTPSVLDDWAYLFDIGVTAKSVHLLTGLNIPGSNISHDSIYKDPDKMGRWMDKALEQDAFKKFNALNNLSKMQQTIKNNALSFPPLQTNYPGIDKHIIPAIKGYPDVMFDFFVYPSETAYFASMDSQFFTRNFYLRRYLVEKTEQLPNATVYAFDTSHDFVLNIANYASVSHAGEPINYLILNSIKQNKDTLNSKNLSKYESSFFKRISNYQVYSSFKEAISLTDIQPALAN